MSSRTTHYSVLDEILKSRKTSTKETTQFHYLKCTVPVITTSNEIGYMHMFRDLLLNPTKIF